MATVARGWRGFLVFLEMIKIEHSVFALPFAMIGMMGGSVAKNQTAWPGWGVFGLIVLAMVSCRSSAMSFNRIVDRNFDSLNPRTATRAIPAGVLRLGTANLYFFASVALFVLSAWLLNPLALALSPVALLATLGYSYTKRFTSLCHFVLGLSLGIAPLASWIAVTGAWDWRPVALGAAVLFWTAGFDVIYSLQDCDFDKGHGLKSLPAAVGPTRALAVSRVCHALAVLCLLWFVQLSLGGIWAVSSVVFAACLLGYEQSLVKPNDLSRVNMAFFTLNGFVSIGVFVLYLLDVLFTRRHAA